MNKPMLSVTIITLNEEDYIKACLQSVQDVADEIVLVDSGSTDRTVEIAKKHGARVYTRDFDTYSAQKNYASKKARGTWIFSIDADETCTPQLAREIKSTIKSGGHDAYTMPRRNIILGKEIKFTRWQKELDRHIWLFKKDKAVWVGDIHEEVEVNGSAGSLHATKMHYQYRTVSEFLDMVNRYTTREAEKAVQNGQRFSLTQMLAEPIYHTALRYIYRQGFRDGWRGFVLSYLMGIYHFAKWIKIWQHARR